MFNSGCLKMPEVRSYGSYLQISKQKLLYPNTISRVQFSALKNYQPQDT
jgi:hypothetical protein